MRRAITIAVVVAVTFMTFAGIARSRAGTGAIPARLSAAGLQQVRFGGYTFRVPSTRTGSTDWCTGNRLG